MKLVEFNVRMYRSIIDSGWVKMDDIAVVVGKNESGKTSLLKALWKFHPFKKEPYNIDREWPRGRRKDRDNEFEVVQTKFEFTPQETAQLAGIDPSCSGLTGIHLGRKYDGKYVARYQPHSIGSERNGKSAIKLIDQAVATACNGKPEPVVTALKTAVDRVRAKFDPANNATAKVLIIEAKTQLVQAATDGADAALAAAIGTACDGITTRVAGSPWDEAWTLIDKWLPRFIYMDDWLAFAGTAYLDQVKARKDQGNPTEEDRTIEMIMEMAGLNLDEEVKKGAENDREQRILDMDDASRTLTDDISARWTQKKYEVRFQADGHHFITFVKDAEAKALVPLEERSKGFQWFFSFDMKFMYETDGEFKNAVILLDEPGLHLHAAAQTDLLKRMKEYAKNNQLIYTTHLPFMIDMNRLDNIWIAEEKLGEGSKVHDQWAAAGKDARFTLQAALGLSWAQSLFIGKKNLVVEGVTDFWFLSTISTMMKEAGQAGIDDALVVTPAGGASKVAYVATLMLGQELKVATLLDSDAEGENARKQLVHNWLVQDGNVLMLGKVVGVADEIELEDLFDHTYYLKTAATAYSKELSNKQIKLAPGKGSIVDRLTKHFEAMSVNFNKGRVAKLIMKDLATQKLDDLPAQTKESFKKVVVAVNEVVARWEQP